MADQLADRGIDASGFAARNLHRTFLQEADLVLTAAREHRARAVEFWPAAVQRSFTLTEFTRLLEAVDPELLHQPSPAERLRVAVGLAARQRGYQPQSDRDDIPDPYGRDLGSYRSAFRSVAAAVDRIQALVGQPSRADIS